MMRVSPEFLESHGAVEKLRGLVDVDGLNGVELRYTSLMAWNDVDGSTKYRGPTHS